jgi:hypothetical protein
MNFDHQTRRSVLRAVLAGLLALLGVTLVRRSQVCAQGGACEGCAQFARCTLPQKVDATSRRVESGGTPLLQQERP